MVAVSVDSARGRLGLCRGDGFESCPRREAAVHPPADPRVNGVAVSEPAAMCDEMVQLDRLP